MEIEYAATLPVYKKDLKPGDIFTRNSSEFEVFLAIYIENNFYFVRLSDAKVFDEHLLPYDEKLFIHHCILKVEM